MNARDKTELKNKYEKLVKQREAMIKEYYEMLKNPRYQRIVEMENKRQANEKKIAELDLAIKGKQSELATLRMKWQQRERERNDNPMAIVYVDPKTMIQQIQMGNPEQGNQIPQIGGNGIVPNINGVQIELMQSVNPIRATGPMQPQLQPQSQSQQPIIPQLGGMNQQQPNTHGRSSIVIGGNRKTMNKGQTPQQQQNDIGGAPPMITPNMTPGGMSDMGGAPPMITPNLGGMGGGAPEMITPSIGGAPNMITPTMNQDIGGAPPMITPGGLGASTSTQGGTPITPMMNPNMGGPIGGGAPNMITPNLSASQKPISPQMTPGGMGGTPITPMMNPNMGGPIGGGAPQMITPNLSSSQKPIAPQMNPNIGGPIGGGAPNIITPSLSASQKPISPQMTPNIGGEAPNMITPGGMSPNVGGTPITPMMNPNMGGAMNGGAPNMITPNLSSSQKPISPQMNPAMAQSGAPNMITPMMNPNMGGPIGGGAPNMITPSLSASQKPISPQMTPNIGGMNTTMTQGGAPNMITPNLMGSVSMNPNDNNTTYTQTMYGGQMNQSGMMNINTSTQYNPFAQQQMMNSQMNIGQSQNQMGLQGSMMLGVSIPLPQQPQPVQNGLQRALHVLQQSYGSYFRFEVESSVPQADLTTFDGLDYDSRVILMETDEGKMVGLFMKAYFIGIEGDTVKVASSVHPAIQIYEPAICGGDYMVVNNSFFIFRDHYQVNNVQNDLVMTDGSDVTRMFTTQPRTAADVNVIGFHILKSTRI